MATFPKDHTSQVPIHPWIKVEVCMDVSRYPATPAILIACAGVRGQRAGFSFCIAQPGLSVSVRELLFAFSHDRPGVIGSGR